MTEKQNGARLLVDCLLKQQVEYIFAIPGAKIDAVFDALLDTPIKVILCRHEQNAAFMAAAYGRLTGKPGVVLVTSGPGVSNLVTGLLTATTEGDPVVALGGNVARGMRLKESHQSTNNVKLTAAATKWSAEAVAVAAIPEMVENAFRRAVAPRSGAVFLSLPQDLLLEETAITATTPVAPVLLGGALPELLQQAAAVLNDAKLPVLLLGLEASRPNNARAIQQLLKTTPIATVSTYQAAGVVTRELAHCFVGRVGLFKNQPGDQLLDAADVVLTVGYNPVEYDPEIWNRGNKKIIHLDYNPVDIHSVYLPYLEIIGDIAVNIEQLVSSLAVKKQLSGHELVVKLKHELDDKIAAGKTHTGERIHPLRFIYELRQMLDDDAIVISDVGSHYMWLARYFFSYRPHHLLFSNGQQTLGVALPWALAARMVYPDKKIISISGDGGFLFSAMELETAVREKLNIVHCVWCDGSYNMVREQQLMKYHRDSAVRLGPVDIVKFAESFGAQGLRVRHSDHLAETLQEAFSKPGPVLIEVPIDYSDNAQLFRTVNHDVGN